jgi:hypothetical protein
LCHRLCSRIGEPIPAVRPLRGHAQISWTLFNLAAGKFNDEDKWNSGAYEYPAGFPGGDPGVIPKWNKEITRLHRLSENRENIPAIYDGLIKASCEAMAAVARTGILGDWKKINFSVSEVEDPIKLIITRDKEIRRMIRLKKR